MESDARKHVVVLGTGFAAFSLARSLRSRHARLTIISPRNHFLFTPLLPSTTVGTIEFRSIIEPVRKACPHAEYLHASCIGILPKRKTIRCVGALDDVPFDLYYDVLVIAVGAINSTYGVPGVERHAMFLRELMDARQIRQRIIERLEQAGRPGMKEEEKQKLLHFVVVGGGPTGVEFAAEMHDFIKEDLEEYYRDLIPYIRITLLEAGAQILNTFDAALGAYTLRQFSRQGIEVRTKSPVVRVEKDRVVLRDGTRITFGVLVWSTGIAPAPLVRKLSLAKDKANRLVTDVYLRVKGEADIYAAGDCMVTESGAYPATAQVAQQEGKYLAGALRRVLSGRQAKPFRYRNLGMLAYVGAGRALADLATVKGRGFAAWLFWRSVYITRLVSVKNKVLVVFDWFKAFLFGRDISKF